MSARAPSRETHLVELVNDAGRPIGERTVEDAHRFPGLLHRAFSVLLLDDAGRILLQRRAAAKTRFPLRWANACCGHPAPGERLPDAANRRLSEELGIPPVTLTEIGIHYYRAEDPTTGRVEHEYDHVLRGDLPAGATLRPDPDEVAELRWISPAELRTDLVTRPEAYAPWLAGVIDRLPGNGHPAPRPGPVVGADNGVLADDAERSGGR